MVTENTVKANDISKKLRENHFQYGDEKTDYISETALKFRKPAIELKIDNYKNKNDNNLQKDYKFCVDDSKDWESTSNRIFTPKEIDDTKNEKKSIDRDNFKLGDEPIIYKSVNQITYLKYPIQLQPIDKSFIENMKKHHYQFCKKYEPDQFLTENKIAYKPINLKDNNLKPKLDSNILKQSHIFEKKNTLSSDDYISTYKLLHTPKTIDKSRVPKINKSAIKISGSDPDSFISNYMFNYKPKIIDTSDAIIKRNKIRKYILGSSFKFDDGEKNEYVTTSFDEYKYEPQSARNAKVVLSSDALDDIKKSHFKLGYGNYILSSSQNEDYKPY